MPQVWILFVSTPVFAILLVTIKMCFKYKLLKMALNRNLINHNAAKITIKTGIIKIPKVLSNAVV